MLVRNESFIHGHHAGATGAGTKTRRNVLFPSSSCSYFSKYDHENSVIHYQKLPHSPQPKRLRRIHVSKCVSTDSLLFSVTRRRGGASERMDGNNLLTVSATLEAEISLKLNINMTAGRKGNQGAGIYSPLRGGSFAYHSSSLFSVVFLLLLLCRSSTPTSVSILLLEGSSTKCMFLNPSRGGRKRNCDIRDDLLTLTRPPPSVWPQIRVKQPAPQWGFKPLGDWFVESWRLGPIRKS